MKGVNVMTFFEQEMRKFLDGNEMLTKMVFCDKMVIGKLDKNVNVKISFNNFGVANNYAGMKVEIINKLLGNIDTQTFKFGDIIDTTNNGERKRITIVQPHICVNMDGAIWVGTNMGEEDREKIMKIIMDYISLFL